MCCCLHSVTALCSMGGVFFLVFVCVAGACNKVGVLEGGVGGGGEYEFEDVLGREKSIAVGLFCMILYFGLRLA